MKALTLTQPWATLVASGAKRIETRSWSTNYRGPLVIHAAKGWKDADRWAAVSEPFYSALLAAFDDSENIILDMPRGCLLAVVQLVDVIKITDPMPVDVHARFVVQPTERDFGDYAPGRYAWLFNHPIVPLPKIPCRGALSLWVVPEDARMEVEACV